MPPRKAGEGSYRLLTGQAVAMRPAAEPPDERMFFSFEEDADMSLDDLPGPRLSDTPILSLSKFSDWLHEKQRLSQGNLFITRKQSDWHRHLEACLIDLPMLRMQVDFSATEGGFDKGFLGFQSEEQFLRRFLYLTMDAGRAASVRDAVAAACDKLRRRPLYLQRLTQLQTFQTSLQTFSTAAIHSGNCALMTSSYRRRRSSACQRCQIAKESSRESSAGALVSRWDVRRPTLLKNLAS